MGLWRYSVSTPLRAFKSHSKNIQHAMRAQIYPGHTHTHTYVYDTFIVYIYRRPRHYRASIPSRAGAVCYHRWPHCSLQQLSNSEDDEERTVRPTRPTDCWGSSDAIQPHIENKCCFTLLSFPMVILWYLQDSHDQCTIIIFFSYPTRVEFLLHLLLWEVSIFQRIIICVS